ncbi:EIF2B4, partial [Symbiodinium sp. KB8]
MIEARHRGIDFRVIVVDSRPWFEGRTALKHLTQEGVECSYVLLNSVSYVMKDVTKVIVGASAMMSNGNVLSRVGTGLLATVANAYKKPVIVCCETYKFCDRVQIDAITANELAEPTELVEREA